MTMYEEKVLINYHSLHIVVQSNEKKKFDVKPNEYKIDFEKSIRSPGNNRNQPNGKDTSITINKAGSILLILRS